MRLTCFLRGWGEGGFSLKDMCGMWGSCGSFKGLSKCPDLGERENAPLSRDGVDEVKLRGAEEVKSPNFSRGVSDDVCGECDCSFSETACSEVCANPRTCNTHWILATNYCGTPDRELKTSCIRPHSKICVAWNMEKFWAFKTAEQCVDDCLISGGGERNQTCHLLKRLHFIS